MLLGKHGLWVLKPPFTKYASNGLLGEIVVMGFIQDQVAKGQDVKTNVYSPVGADGLYSADLSSNCIIVTIDSGGKYFSVPDKYIENLYSGDQHFCYHYMSVKIGMLPRTYDLSEACHALAQSVSEVTGVNVQPKDIYVSVSEKDSVVLSDKEGVYENLRRVVATDSNDSIYTKLKNSQDQKTELEKKYNDLSESYIKLLNKE